MDGESSLHRSSRGQLVDDPHDVLAIRHTYKESGLPSRAAATPERVLAYTREQHHVGKFPKEPARHWLIFMGEGGRRSRLTAVYENRGEVVAERTERHRYYDVAPVPLLASLEERLVVEWSADPVNWAKRGPLAARFPVLEIADPTTEAFPGFDHVLLSYGDLQSLVTETRYAGWRTALEAVRGIYLIADETAGQCYVGKADGERGVLGRWEAYARDGLAGTSPSGMPWSSTPPNRSGTRSACCACSAPILRRPRSTPRRSTTRTL